MTINFLETILWVCTFPLIVMPVSILPFIDLFHFTSIVNYNYRKDLFSKMFTRSFSFPEENFFFLNIKEITVYNPQMQRLLELKWR